MKSERFLLMLGLIAINLFGLAIVYLGATEKLGIYIHLSSQWFVLLTGLLFLFFNFRGIPRKESLIFERSALLGIISLLVVAVLIFSIKPVPLSVETAKTRISGGSSPVNANNRERFATRKTSDFGIVDWLAAFTNPEESFRYENTPADITGFLLMQDGQPMVGRLVITCCGADAQPAVIRFRWAKDLPEENTWIRIKGTMHTIDMKPVLEATSLDVIPEPKNPYAE